MPNECWACKPQNHIMNKYVLAGFYVRWWCYYTHYFIWFSCDTWNTFLLLPSSIWSTIVICGTKQLTGPCDHGNHNLGCINWVLKPNKALSSLILWVSCASWRGLVQEELTGEKGVVYSPQGHFMVIGWGKVSCVSSLRRAIPWRVHFCSHPHKKHRGKVQTKGTPQEVICMYYLLSVKSKWHSVANTACV